ncbi:MAG: PAS domain S-box protein, partial [bacterium]
LYTEEQTITPVSNGAGEVTHFIGIKQDVTKRKQLAVELTRLKEFNENIVHNIDEGIIIEDSEGKWSFINPSIEKMLGYSKDELVGEHWSKIIAPREFQKIVKESERRRKGEKSRYESCFVCKDGTELPVLVSSTPLFDRGEFRGVLSAITDISERKRGEEDRIAAHQLTEQLLTSIPSILIGVGKDDRITRWNTAAEQTFGIKGSGVIGRPFLQCGIDWDWCEVLHRISMYRKCKQLTRLDDIRYSRPDGKEGFLNIHINPVVGDSLKQAGFLLLATEITERKNLEGQLAQAQKLESIGQLASGIAHEINTPIQYVGDNIRFMQDAFEDLRKLLDRYRDLFEAAKEKQPLEALIPAVETTTQEIDLEYLVDEIPLAVQQSLEGVERVSNIVRAMKEFSHPGQAEKSPIDINRALENTITVARNEWKYVAELKTDFCPTLPLVPCLRGELNQVLLNILVNAAQAIAEATEGDSSKKGTITVTTRHDDQCVEIRIADTGPGIPKKVRSKIFDPFFTTKEVGKGTGQGLAISHNVVVEKHGGSITFETEVGKGTTFVIRLPIRPSNQ